MNTERETKVKSILITQPEPEPGRNVYEDFVNRYKLTMDFRAFIHIEPLTAREIRKQKINFLDYTAIIFNSRNAVDYFFQMAQEMKVEMPAETKYFSINESVSNYVQKYIVPRKRKMFTAKGTEKDFFTLFKNILENAIQHAPRDTEVRVEIDSSTASVRDWGSGVTQEQLSHIFSRFWRGAHRRDHGAGLGLTICHEIAIAHGWTLSAHRADPGLRLQLSLPVAIDPKCL